MIQGGWKRNMSAINILYAQSGGVTPVINASASGVISQARRHDDQIGQVFAAKDGVMGILQERLINTQDLSAAEVVGLRHTPGGVFGSCRYKLGDPAKDPTDYARLVEVLTAHKIDVLLYNGGNDSADTTQKVAQYCQEVGAPIRCIGVPKTIDNDLAVTDNSPGFGSVAKYVAVSILEASLDVMSMASSSTKVFIMEVMGRHAGWIAAAGGLAAQAPGDPPQIILFPERPFDEAKFCEAVKRSVEQHGYCSIVVSEGVRDAKGHFLADAGTTDAFGHKQLGGVAPVVANIVSKTLGYKYHWAVSDYLQRSARHVASATDAEQAYAVGQFAVDMAVQGITGQMPVIVRDSDTPYKWHIEPADVAQIANHEKVVPDHFITEDGFGITEAARRYLAPLIAGEDYPPYDATGLPAYVRPQFTLVEKRCPSWNK